MPSVNFEFKEQKHLEFFVELLITGSLNYVQVKNELEAEIRSLRSAAPKAPSEYLTLDLAKTVLQKEGYIFYKKPPGFGGGRPTKKNGKEKK